MIPNLPCKATLSVSVVYVDQRKQGRVHFAFYRLFILYVYNQSVSLEKGS